MQPALVGILNVTPDSFYDGGRWVAAPVEQGLRLWAEGAEWIDVGGESTRPGSEPVPVELELQRVLPVVRGLVEGGCRVSIDTQKPEVARQALAAGAEVVNDVGGLRDPGMLQVVAEAGAGVVIMHMRGLPATMQRDTRYDALVEDVRAFLQERIEVARAAGIARIWADPGIGFGKSAEQSAELLRRLPELGALGVPLYVGASRKSFLRLAGEGPEQRLPASLGVALAAALKGAAVLRVHDVAATRQALRAFAMCTAEPGGRA